MLVGAVVGGVYAYRRLRDPAERRRLADWLDRQGRRPALRPLAAVIRPLARRVVLPAFRAAAPPVRFARGRLTPGRLGIEFTTAVAVGAAGLYVFALYTVVIAGGREQMALDREGLSLAGDLRSSPAVDAVTALTDLAAFPVVATLVVLALAVLASRRRTAELITLAAGFVLVYAGVQLAKAGVDRPRPAGALVETSGASFPSGHAAYSTAYVALTVAARRALPGLFTRAAAIAAALGTAAVLGLTRVYLQAHYLSDVIGGWALGLGVFGACSAVALLVVHIRQNAAVPQTDSPADHE
jgi:undecaprenyl-diphosphatase